MADHHEPSSRTPLLRDDPSSIGPASTAASVRGGTNVKSSKQREIARYASFLCANLATLCAGSLTAYSLYGHLFQERLRYSQYQVNIVIIAAELAMYLPVPLFGYLCDRIGPAPLSLFGAVMFGAGYILAAFTYQSGTAAGSHATHERGWPFPIMVVAFVAIGLATVSMYLSAVTTCAKNFGRGKYRGLALASPIAAFGLSGLWQSQIGSRILYERNPDGSRGDVDVFKYFLFLAIVLFAVGLLGTVGLKIVDEEDLIDNAVEELEASGYLDRSDYFQRSAQSQNYGSILTEEEAAENGDVVARQLLDPKAREEEEARKKNWLLNEESSRFLKDHTMWWLAAGLFLVSGPGDTFINNLGTIIGTLYPPLTDPSRVPTTAATHVSIVAVTSTVARLATGTVTDILAPVAATPYHRTSAANSLSSLPPKKRFTVSRIWFLIGFALILSIGQVFLASGLAQNHGERFWIVSTLIGIGYGAVFSLVPIVISVIWGVENFGTNWGIVAMVPAFGAMIWGIVYSAIYQNAANRIQPGLDGGTLPATEDVLCYGKECYAPTFWAMTIGVWIACGLWLWAWKGKNGWSSRGIPV